MIIPDGTKAGETFKAIATFRLQKDNQLELCAIQDNEVGDSASEDKKEKKGFVETYADTMKGS